MSSTPLLETLKSSGAPPSFDLSLEMPCSKEEILEALLKAANSMDAEGLDGLLNGYELFAHILKTAKVFEKVLETLLDNTSDDFRFEKALIFAEKLYQHKVGSSFSYLCEAACSEKLLLQHGQILKAGKAVASVCEVAQERMRNLVVLIRKIYEEAFFSQKVYPEMIAKKKTQYEAHVNLLEIVTVSARLLQIFDDVVKGRGRLKDDTRSNEEVFFHRLHPEIPFKKLPDDEKHSKVEKTERKKTEED